MTRDKTSGRVQGGSDAAPGARADAAAEGSSRNLLSRALDALRTQLDALEICAAAGTDDLDERAEAVRERYSELLEDYGDDGDAVSLIRALGRRIADLEDSGAMPRSLIRRGRSRR